MNQFETIQDSSLDQVTGGLSFNIGFDSNTGLTASGPLGEISVPSPLSIAQNVIGTATNTISTLLQKVGAAFTKLGQLFDLS